MLTVVFINIYNAFRLWYTPNRPKKKKKIKIPSLCVKFFIKIHLKTYFPVLKSKNFKFQQLFDSKIFISMEKIHKSILNCNAIARSVKKLFLHYNVDKVVIIPTVDNLPTQIFE